MDAAATLFRTAAPVRGKTGGSRVSSSTGPLPFIVIIICFIVMAGCAPSPDPDEVPDIVDTLTAPLLVVDAEGRYGLWDIPIGTIIPLGIKAAAPETFVPGGTPVAQGGLLAAPAAGGGWVMYDHEAGTIEELPWGPAPWPRPDPWSPRWALVLDGAGDGGRETGWWDPGPPEGGSGASGEGGEPPGGTGAEGAATGFFRFGETDPRDRIYGISWLPTGQPVWITNPLGDLPRMHSYDADIQHIETDLFDRLNPDGDSSYHFNLTALNTDHRGRGIEADSNRVKIIGTRMFPVDPNSYHLFAWDPITDEVLEAPAATFFPAFSFLGPGRMAANTSEAFGGPGETIRYTFYLWDLESDRSAAVADIVSRHPWVVALNEERWGFLEDDGRTLAVADREGKVIGPVTAPSPLLYIHPYPVFWNDE